MAKGRKDYASNTSTAVRGSPRHPVDYATVFAHAPDAMLIFDGEGRYVDANIAAEKLTGFSRDEILTKRVGDLTIPDEKQLSARRFDVLRARGRARKERTVLRKDGTPIAVEAHAVALENGMFQTTLRDITEKKDALDQLSDALQTLRFHIERMPLAYIVWNRDFRVEEWNPAAERIFGYTQNEALGKHAYDLVVPEAAVTTVNKVWADLLAGDTSSHSINNNIRKDGSQLTCEWFNTPLRDAKGHIRGVASMAMDVTERELVEQRLRDAQKLESLGVLAGGVAHDFNNTLMVILGNASLLRSIKSLPANAMQFIEMIEESGLRASELIRHLLAYARTGKHNPETTDLNEIVRDAHMFLQSSVGKDFEIQLRLEPNLPLVNVDRSQMDQILLNLCVNARQAMEDQGTIAIETRAVRLDAAAVRRVTQFSIRPGAYVELIVSDGGHGMDEETIRRVFDPFFTTKREGHGLGLAAVSGILRQHGAAARIESKPGSGCTFHVYFPVHAETASQKSQANSSDSRSRRSKPNNKKARPGRRSGGKNHTP